jgi:hypothetical protein
MVEKDQHSPGRSKGEALNRIVPEDAPALREHFSNNDVRTWCCFTPYLYHTCDAGKQLVYWRKWQGSLFLCYSRFSKGSQRWDILTFVADDRKMVKTAVELMDELNGHRRGRILWVPEDSLSLIDEGLRFSFRLRDRECFYDSEAVRRKRGGAFADIRKHVNRFRRENPLHRIVPLGRPLVEGCLDFLDRWTQSYLERESRHANAQKTSGRRKGANLPLDHYYVRNAVRDFGVFSRRDLQGWVITGKNEILGLALAGEISPVLANFFALKTCRSFFGISAYLRWHVLSRLAEQGYPLVNDASDLNRPGLAQHKAKFRPVDYLPIYRAHRMRSA